MKDFTVDIILESLNEINETFKDKKLKDISRKTQLFGSKGQLDSLGLVTLVALVESKISDKYNKSITIASEKAMSMKSSPFKSVLTLAKFVEELLNEK